MGLFKPAWQSDNYDKAMKAVNKETNQIKLFNVVKYAPLEHVRIAALKKLNDQSILAKIAKTNDDSLTQEILTNLALYSNIDERLKAAAGLADRDLAQQVNESSDNIPSKGYFRSSLYVEDSTNPVKKQSLYWVIFKIVR